MIFQVEKDGSVIFPDGKQGRVSKLMKDENNCFTLHLCPNDRKVELSAEETRAFIMACIDAEMLGTLIDLD